MFNNIDLYDLQYNAFIIFICISWALYILIALGVSTTAPQYLGSLQSVVKIYVSLFLIVRFNPFRNVTFTKLDTKIAFTSGLFLLATTAVDTYLQQIKQYVLHYVNVNNPKTTTM